MGSSYRDLVKKVNEKKKATTAQQGREVASSTVSGKKSSYQELVQRVNSGKVRFRPKMDSSQVDQWYKGVTEISTKGYEYLKKEGYRPADTAISDSIGTYLQQAGDVARYLRANQDSFDNYEQLIKDHTATVTYLQQLKNKIQESNVHFSKWGNEEEYQKDLQESRRAAEENDRLLGMDTEQEAKIVELLEGFAGQEDVLKQYHLKGNYDDLTVQHLERDLLNFKQMYGVPEGETFKSYSSKRAADLETAKRLQAWNKKGSVGNPEAENYDPEYDVISGQRVYALPSMEDLVNYDQMTDESSWAMGADGQYRDVFGNVVDVNNTDDKGNIIHPVTAGGKYDTTDRLGIFLNESQGNREVTYDPASPIGQTWTKISQEGMQKNWGYIKNAELQTYYYYLNKEGWESAEEYLNSIQERLNQRASGKDVDALQGKPVLQTLYNLGASWDSSAQNVHNYLFGKDAYTPATKQQFAAAAMRQEMEDAGNTVGTVAFDLAGTVGNMVPSILTSTLIGMFSKTAGAAVGAGLMGASAAGNAYQEKINAGYSAEEAKTYGTMVGVSEAAMEYMLGGISKLGGKGLQTVFKNLDKVDNVFARVAKSVPGKLVASGLSEAGEEYLQALIEPALWEAVSGEDMTADQEEALYNALLGFLSGGLFESAEMVGSGVQSNIYDTARGQEIVDAGTVGSLQEIARSMDLSRQADKVSGETGTGKGIIAKLKDAGNTRRVGKLYGEITRENIKRSQADLANRLTEQGFSRDTALTLAETLVAARTGAELTSGQKALLQAVENDSRVTESVAGALANVFTDLETESGQRNVKMDLFRMATEMRNRAAREPATEVGVTLGSLAEDMAVEENLENDTPPVTAGGDSPLYTREPVESAAEDGKLLDGETFRRSTGDVVQVKIFKDFTSGKATVQLQDGTTAPADDISFSGSDDGPFHLIATEENMTAPAANQMWQLWENIKANGLPVSAEQYGSAAITLFRAGWKGDSAILSDSDSRAAALSKSQRELIYEAGRKAARAKTDAQQANVDKVYSQADEMLQQRGAPHKGIYRAVAVDGLAVNKMTRQQKAAFEMASLIAPGVKGNMELYDGGKEWGYYDHKRDVIRLNINAKWNQTSMMTFTLGHELAHRAALGSPKKFQAFADFLVEKYVEQGTSLEELIGEQLQSADEFDKTLPEEKRLHMTETQALEEVVADACQRMLLDTDAGQRLAEFGAKSRENRSIVQDIKKWIREFMDRVRRSFRNVMPDSKAAQKFDRFDQQTKQLLADMFVDMTMDAGEKLSTIKAAGMTEKITTDRGGVRYSLSKNARVELHKALYDRQYRDDVLLRDESPAIMLAQKGVKNRPMAMKASHIRENVFSEQEAKKLGLPIRKDINYHGLGEDFFLQVIDGLDDVKEAYRGTKNADNPSRRENYFLLISTYTDADGNTINVPVYIDEHAQYNRVFVDVNKIATVYGKENLQSYLNREIQNKNLVRIKNRSNLTSERSAPIAEGYGKNASADSIRNPEQNVNKKTETDATMPHKIPVSRDVADRGKLVDLFEQMVTSSDEYKVLENYRKHMQEMLQLEEHLDRISTEIHRISFTEGPRDMELLNKLKLQQKQAINRLNYYDNRLLGLEKSGVLKGIIERYRKQITQDSFNRAKTYYQERNERRENEIRQYYRESRRQAVERHDMAEIRQRIRKDVQRLDSLLNKGTKEKNVKAELKAFAGAALRTAKGTFLKDYSEYDMIRNGVNTTLSREQKVVFARCKELLAELDRLRDQQNAEPSADNLHDKWDPEAALRREDRMEALQKELAKNMAVLRETGVFRTENELMEDSTAEQLMTELLDAYKALGDSESAHVRGVFSDVVYGQMEEVKKFLAGKAIKDMTTIELRELQKMYRMVLHTITTSNDLFAQKRKADVRKLGEEVIEQLRTGGKEMIPEILDRLKKMGWSNLKPETALELIGSDTLTEMMQGLYRGEDTYAQDIDHARAYAEEQGKKYGRKKWDLEESISFAGTKITLGQAMSLYAYTKRKQAQGHLEGDGFTHSSNVRIKDKKGNVPVAMKYIMNATKTHKITKDMYSQVAQLLTAEQRKYVDAMQVYLSKVMGAKGNEVSMQLYGIDLFEETDYFPLKTAAEFRDTALAVKRGDVKLKNSGFTQSVQKDAANPIVLDSFEKVWAAHVDKMSMYHGFVLPMEDFDRVYNYHRTEERGVTDAMGEVYKTELVDTNETVKVDIENKMGKAANEYIETFMQQLNGGVRQDPVENLFGGALKSFKKSAVMASLSVAVQQPTAFVRAMAYLDMKDIADWKNWLGKAGKPDGKLVEEMYKYAPVALMKKIGGFDPGLGRTAQNYIFEGSGVMDVVDKVGGWLPEHMDQWTWTYIWVCTKRQIHRLHPELRVGSEEFCKKAGERFSQIIRRTQVYDSVLTKSQIMRSKNVFLQMSTSFMNEPTTSLDMYISAAVQAKQGKISKKQAARAYGAVIGSQILVAAISSFVYAARDDDEDETYWEKYVSSFVGKSIEGITMLQSIPFIRDIVSIFEGYSAERSDMALYQDLYQGWQKLQSDNATPWEKTEAFAGSVLNFFGIPLKNVSRDVRAIYRVAENIFNSSRVKATKAGMRYAVMEGLPFTDKPAKTVQIESAVKENDGEHMLRLIATYNTEDAAHTAVRKAVKNVYLQGKITAEYAMDFLQVYAANDAEEAQEYLIKWDFGQQHAGVELSDAQILDWNDYAEPAGISLEIYTRFCEETKELVSDKNEDGKTVANSKREKVWEVIHSLPITRKQKDALHYASGYKESSLEDAPWN